ncbi:hypothetical protein [Arthrobacter sp. 2MCAF14]|uniref:hypothetical protein n=1 Tax=Arthrobacter sp. 2MCAF14 TaxID=3232982 RepID=UPI003F8E7CC7
MDPNAAIIAADDPSSRAGIVFGVIGILIAIAAIIFIFMMAEVAISALIEKFPSGPGIMMGAGAVSLVLAFIFSSEFFGIVGGLLLGIPILLMLMG